MVVYRIFNNNVPGATIFSTTSQGGPLFLGWPLLLGGGGTIFSTTPRGTFSTTFFIRRHMFVDFFSHFFSQKPLLFSTRTKMINKNHSLQARGNNDKTTWVAYFAEIVAPGHYCWGRATIFSTTSKGGLRVWGGHYCWGQYC